MIASWLEDESLLADARETIIGPVRDALPGGGGDLSDEEFLREAAVVVSAPPLSPLLADTKLTFCRCTAVVRVGRAFRRRHENVISDTRPE